MYYIVYCGEVIERNNSVAKHSKFTTKEVKNLSDIARITWSNLVRIAYSWIQIRTEFAYVPLRLCDTICSLFSTHGLFCLRIAVMFIFQLCKSIQYFTQDSFFGFRICLFICLPSFCCFISHIFFGLLFVFSFSSYPVFSFLVCLFRCFFI